MIRKMIHPMGCLKMAAPGRRVPFLPALLAVCVFAGWTVAGAVGAGAQSPTPALADANKDLQAGNADAARAKLDAILRADPGSAPANNLLCRVEYALQQFDQAASHCEKAADASAQNAEYRLWLARALGERASRASWTSAFSLAKKCRAEFEAAVQLDPRNPEALSDLGEFYMDAPGVIGGGTDKAAEIATRLVAVDAAAGHSLRAELAERNKDLPAAEQELKSALSASAHPARQWMALASFYRRRERWSDLDEAIRNGVAAAARDKRAAVAYFDGATVLARANRNLDEAVKLFETYIASPGKTEEAPAFDALTRLARLRLQMGDRAGAERDKAAALALAHDYKPALEAAKDARNR